MGKVKSPLFGISAKGKLANTLVFSSWKGQSTVRLKKDPANPNSSAQQAERTKYGLAVEHYRTDGLTTSDIQALQRLASQKKHKGSGYNEFVKLCIDCQLAGETWPELHGVIDAYAMSGVLGVTAYGLEVSEMVMHYGNTKFCKGDTYDMNFMFGMWQGALMNCVLGETYYYTFYSEGIQVGGLYTVTYVEDW